MTKEEIEAVFNLKINFLDYYRLKCFLKSYLTRFNIQEFKCVKPIYPSIFKILKTQNGCNTFYQRLNKDHIFPEKRLKLAQKLSLLITDNKWCMSKQICFRTIQDNTIKWFQYKLIHGILGTRQFLKQEESARERALCQLTECF